MTFATGEGVSRAPPFFNFFFLFFFAFLHPPAFLSQEKKKYEGTLKERHVLAHITHDHAFRPPHSPLTPSPRGERAQWVTSTMRAELFFARRGRRFPRSRTAQPEEGPQGARRSQVGWRG